VDLVSLATVELLAVVEELLADTADLESLTVLLAAFTSEELEILELTEDEELDDEMVELELELEEIVDEDDDDEMVEDDDDQALMHIFPARVWSFLQITWSKYDAKTQIPPIALNPTGH
jgi:hypothetical protein